MVPDPYGSHSSASMIGVAAQSQHVNIHVSLSPSSIIWYLTKGADANSNSNSNNSRSAHVRWITTEVNNQSSSHCVIMLMAVQSSASAQTG